MLLNTRLNRCFIATLAAFVILAGVAFGAYTTKNYMDNNGDTWNVGGIFNVLSGGSVAVKSGGSLDVESGGALKIGGTSMTQTAPILNGQWRLVALGALTNGAAAGKTLALVDETPAGEFTASDADVTCTTDTTTKKSGTASLKLGVLATADAGDGCSDSVTADFSADESVGFWAYSTVALAAGDVVFSITDDGGAHTINVPALAANTWTYVNLTTGITALADADKNSITVIAFNLSAAGATKAASTPFSFFVDEAFKWDATEQHSLGAITPDAVVTAIGITATTAVTAQLTELTDHFIAFSGTTGLLVGITDKSTLNGLAVVNY